MVSKDSVTVLVVDDERSIRASLRTILAGLGFTVVEAARGEEAVALVRTAQFDAVLLDIQMPGTTRCFPATQDWARARLYPWMRVPRTHRVDREAVGSWPVYRRRSE